MNYLEATKKGLDVTTTDTTNNVDTTQKTTNNYNCIMCNCYIDIYNKNQHKDICFECEGFIYGATY